MNGGWLHEQRPRGVGGLDPPALQDCRARPMNPERRVEDPDWSGIHTGARCSGIQVRAAVSKSSSTTVCLLATTSTHSSKSGSGNSAHNRDSRINAINVAARREFHRCTCGSSSLVLFSPRCHHSPFLCPINCSNRLSCPLMTEHGRRSRVLRRKLWQPVTSQTEWPLSKYSRSSVGARLWRDTRPLRPDDFFEGKDCTHRHPITIMRSELLVAALCTDLALFLVIARARVLTI